MSEEEKFKHICEVCNKYEELTSEEAFQQGWDYPPRMGQFGMISPRTCGNCAMEDTLWWRIVHHKLEEKNFTEKDVNLIYRINNEPNILKIIQE